MKEENEKKRVKKKEEEERKKKKKIGNFQLSVKIYLKSNIKKLFVNHTF